MMIFSRPVAGVLLVSVAALNFSILASAYGQSAQAPASDPTNAGKAVFSRANCVGCHKWHGNGGGGYGGDALSLRKTEMARDQIIETVGCGRPGTGMPFFTRGAYDEVKCHGMNRQDAGAQMPPEGGTFLRAERYRSRRRLRDRAHQGSWRAHLRGMRHLLLKHVAGMRRLQDAGAEAGPCDRQHGKKPMMDRLMLIGRSRRGPACLAGRRTRTLSGTDGRVRRQRSA